MNTQTLHDSMPWRLLLVICGGLGFYLDISCRSRFGQ